MGYNTKSKHNLKTNTWLSSFVKVKDSAHTSCKYLIQYLLIIFFIKSSEQMQTSFRMIYHKITKDKFMN
jgi:hypothetical protein